MVGHSYSTNADFRVSVRTFTATLFATVCFAVCVLLLVCSYKKSSGNMTKTARSEIYIQQLEQTFFYFSLFRLYCFYLFIFAMLF